MLDLESSLNNLGISFLSINNGIVNVLIRIASMRHFHDKIKTNTVKHP